MHSCKFVRTVFNGRRLLVLLTAILLVTGLFSTQAPDTAFAWIGENDDPLDRIREPEFQAPADGFAWAMARRYGTDIDGDGMIESGWVPDLEDDPMKYGEYNPSFIFPDRWDVTFRGCQSEADYYGDLPAPNIYTWEIVDQQGVATPFSNDHHCVVSHHFTAQGTYTVRLTVHDASGNILPEGKTNPEYFEQEVTIRDILVVAMGDSIASGEGNPDIPQVYTDRFPLYGWDVIHQAVWQNKRCNRSAYNGPSMAAMALENSDPHTSVTFINFACSSASVFTENIMHGDPNHPIGSGLLGYHWGAEEVGVPYGAVDRYIPPQMVQLERALIPPAGKPARQIDSLIIIAGANDLHFGEIELSLVLAPAVLPPFHNWDIAPIAGYWTSANEVIQRGLGHQGDLEFNLPNNFTELYNRINALQPAAPAHVYLTQYPDMFRADNGDFCDDTLADAVWPPVPAFKIDRDEARDLMQSGFDLLNEHLKEVAELYQDNGWQYVDGITVFDHDPAVQNKPQPGLFVRGHDGRGHGYCASDNWIVRAGESELLQGPVNEARVGSRGKMHPNYGGNSAIKERLLRYMVPDLAIIQPQLPPAITFSHSLNGFIDVASENGWYLQSCAGDNTCRPMVVGQAVATSTARLDGAEVSVNGVEGCAISGVTCRIPESSDPYRVTYEVEITTSGLYQFQFAAQDSSGQIATHEQWIKVDLDGPVLADPIGPFEVPEDGSVVLSASATSTNEAVFDYDWDLDNDGTYETTDEQPTFSAAGLEGPATRTVAVLAIDRAGRAAIGSAQVNILDPLVMVTINGAPAESPEMQTIHLTSTVSGPNATDPLTYAWVVRKDGANYATGANADLSFTPIDNGAYEVALTVTGGSGIAETTTLTINVTNLAPSVAITAPANGTLNALGSTVSIRATLADPSSADTLTCSVDWGDSYAGTGTMAPGGVCTASYTYVDPKVYTIRVTGSDDDAGATTKAVMAVVYDASQKYFAGGGWIDSPAGAYPANPALVGHADFGFEINFYPIGTPQLPGYVVFQIPASDFSFQGWTNVKPTGSGATVQLKGTGKVNGASGYSFLVTATDGQYTSGGGVDKYRIKIWNTSTNAVVYDNRMGSPTTITTANPQPIGGGSIVK